MAASKSAADKKNYTIKVVVHHSKQVLQVLQTELEKLHTALAASTVPEDKAWIRERITSIHNSLTQPEAKEVRRLFEQQQEGVVEDNKIPSDDE